MATYTIETRQGKTKFGHNVYPIETIANLESRFVKAKKSEKELYELLKADPEITITKIEDEKKEIGIGNTKKDYIPTGERKKKD